MLCRLKYRERIGRDVFLPGATLNLSDEDYTRLKDRVFVLDQPPVVQMQMVRQEQALNKVVEGILAHKRKQKFVAERRRKRTVVFDTAVNNGGV